MHLLKLAMIDLVVAAQMRLHHVTYLWEAEFQLLLRKFLASSVYSLIRGWLMPGRVSGHQKLALISMDGQLPDGDWTTSG